MFYATANPYIIMQRYFYTRRPLTDNAFLQENKDFCRKTKTKRMVISRILLVSVAAVPSSKSVQSGYLICIGGILPNANRCERVQRELQILSIALSHIIQQMPHSAAIKKAFSWEIRRFCGEI